MEVLVMIVIILCILFRPPVVYWLLGILVLGIILGICRYLLGERNKRK